jgi:hypothetical protein
VHFTLRLASPLTALLLGVAATAQSFDFPTFADTSPLTLNGSATQVGSNLRLTNNGASQTGSAWYTTPVPVAEGFDTQFQFVMTTSPEGLAFVIQGSPNGALAIGGGLWGIGYGFGVSSSPIPNSIAIEIDAVQDGFLNDTSSNEVSIHTVGALGNSENESVSIARITPAGDLSNNAVHTMRVSYMPGPLPGSPGVLEVYVDNLTTPLLSTAFSFENGGTQLTGGSTGGLGLAGAEAWVGFTSATMAGSSGQNVEIRSWNWVSFARPDDCYEGNVQLGSGGPHDLLTINGDNGGFFRTARLAVADPFTLAVDPPPGEVSAPFLLLVFPVIANAATVTTTPWGESCFPLVFPVDLGGASAPFSVNFPAGIFLPMELSLQAVMATDSSDPNVLELTNAIGLQFSLAPAPAITLVLPGSAPAGATITISGSNFSQFATVDLNSVPVPVLSASQQQITFAMPASVPCAATLRVRNPDGSQATVPFNPVPTITSQVNTSGPQSGGTTYIVIGNGFAAGTTVTIGGNAATVTTANPSIVICTTPPGSPGPATVVITTPGGCSVNSTFTYL